MPSVMVSPVHSFIHECKGDDESGDGEGECLPAGLPCACTRDACCSKGCQTDGRSDLSHDTEVEDEHIGDQSGDAQTLDSRCEQSDSDQVSGHGRQCHAQQQAAQSGDEQCDEQAALTRGPDEKVAVTGELYIKFCALGNGETEKYLRDLGCHIYMSGFVPYIMYLTDSCTNDDNIYGRKTLAGVGAKVLIAYMKTLWCKMNSALVQNGFEPMEDYRSLKSYGENFGCLGETMGDGWLIGAEMCSALKNGCKGVVMLLPFGCLVSHTCARGIIKRIKKLYPDSIITAVDHDSGTADVNIKNRIKMTLDFMDNNIIKHNKN